jgi:hypothetical protein
MKIYLLLIAVCILLSQCTHSSKESKEPSKSGNDVFTTIDFGNIKTEKMSEIIDNYSFVKLESNEDAIVGNIGQIEVYKEKIYILDRYTSRTLYVFSIEGTFIRKLAFKGNGPGEFISPSSFYIDTKGYILILDATLNRLLKYNLDDLSFVEEIVLPLQHPSSFFVLPETDLFCYYYPGFAIKDTENKQVIIADKKGNKINSFFEITPLSKVTHTDITNFYAFNGKLSFYPDYTDKIFSISTDTLFCRYQLSFGKYKRVNEDIATKTDDVKAIMSEIYTGNQDWVHSLCVYETENELLVRYFVKTRMFVGIWNKQTGKVHNFEYNKIEDDLGFGGIYPYPKGKYNNQYIGEIKLYEIDKALLKNETLKVLVNSMEEDDNSILVFYNSK